MGLNKVAIEIRENAEKEAQRLIGEGKREGERLLEEAKRRLKEQEAEVRKERDNAFRQIELRNQAMTKKQMKEFAMNIKKELVEKVYKDFLEYLKGTKASEKARNFRSMLALAKKQIDKPKIVYVRRDEVALARKIFRGLEVRPKEMDGGFMLESADGKEMVDFKFETLVEMLKGRTLKTVSKTLFGE